MKPRIILIPGLGADWELFYPQLEHFGERLQILDDAGEPALWHKQPSMAEAALVFTERLRDVVPDGQPYVLGGMSFGGS